MEDRLEIRIMFGEDQQSSVPQRTSWRIGLMTTTSSARSQSETDSADGGVRRPRSRQRGPRPIGAAPGVTAAQRLPCAGAARHGVEPQIVGRRAVRQHRVGQQAQAAADCAIHRRQRSRLDLDAA